MSVDKNSMLSKLYWDNPKESILWQLVEPLIDEINNVQNLDVDGTGAATNLAYWSDVDTITNTPIVVDNDGNLSLPTNKTVKTNIISTPDIDGNLTIDSDTIVTGTLNINSMVAIASDSDKFVMSDSNELKYVSGTNLKSYIELDNVENTALSTWVGSLNITTLGTINSGEWNGDALEIAYGGTGWTSPPIADNRFFIGNSSGNLDLATLTEGVGISFYKSGITGGMVNFVINCDLEGTSLSSTGESGGAKFLREDGDGTCSWQTVSGISNVVEDTTPQLGGNLDVNGNHIVDANGNELLKFSNVSSALNYFEITNAVGTGSPILSVDGSENVDFKTEAKGTGDFHFVTNTDRHLKFDFDGASQHKTMTLKSNHTDSRIITLPDSTGTMALTSDIAYTSAISEGNSGLVPSVGTAGHFLKHDGTFGLPSYTVYTAGTGINIDGSNIITAASIALTTVQTAASQVAHLALTAQEGDIVVRSDENKTYCHNGGTAGTMADYTLLETPTDAVLSVNGDIGAVTVTHDGLSDFVANEHIDWTIDQGATDIHSGNYTDTTYTSSDFAHDSLSGVTANEHIDWTSASAGVINVSNLSEGGTGDDTWIKRLIPGNSTVPTGVPAGGVGTHTYLDNGDVYVYTN